MISCVAPVLTYAWLPALSAAPPGETGLKTQELTDVPHCCQNSASAQRCQGESWRQVLHEVQRSSLIALSGQGGHINLMPTRLCVPSGAGSEVSYGVQGAPCGQLGSFF